VNHEDLTRPFPFTVRPGHRETLESYTHRTLTANGAADTVTRELLKLAHTADPTATWETILSAKTRRDLSRLTAPASRDIHRESEACAPCGSLLTERWMCILCSHGEHIQQHPHLDDFLCERHHRWTGPNTVPTTQSSVSTKTVAAHRRLQKLRHAGRADLPLLVDVIEALTADLGETAPAVFPAAVAITDWVTQPDTLRRLFDPSRPYAATFAWMTEALASLTIGPAPATSRIVWLHLWPAHLALQTALRGYRSYHPTHSHDFTLPANVTEWYPHPDTFQSHGDYLACTGDTNLSAVAQHHQNTDAETTPNARRVLCTFGHEYNDVIFDQDGERHPTVCPQCTGRHVIPGVNDLATISPAVAAELHPTRNGTLRATGIAAYSGTTVWWQCPEKGHPYAATPSNRTLNSSGCSVCLNRVLLRGVNDFATTHPRLAAELHPSRANSQAATNFTAGDTRRLLWLCGRCGHEFRASAEDRVKGRRSCENCKKERTRASGRSIAAKYPDLAKTWLPELNEGRRPDEFTKGSGVEVIWWCENGKHPFKMRIEARTRGCGCPYCAGRRILPGFNDLATTNPAIAAEWHPYLNRKTPSEVMAGSDPKFMWECPNGHRVPQRVPNRIKSGGCPECPRHERALQRLGAPAGRAAVHRT